MNQTQVAYNVPVTMISCIVFDLSEVIIAGLVGVERVLAERFGIDASTALEHLGGERLARLCCGGCSEREYLSAVRAVSGWTIPDVELQRAIRQNFHQRVAGMPELIDRLARTHELVLLSDHGREWVSYIEGIHPFLGAFSQRIFSFQTGVMKSSRATFEHILRLIGKHAAECLFIDDSDRNVRCAREAGMNAIRFTGIVELERELAAMGLSGPEDRR